MEGMWIIGYGSLIFKPPPIYSFKVTGYLEGYIRRFWQSSSDHRGTPESPGRVVTLISLQDLLENPKFHNDLQMYELNQSEITTKTHKIDQLAPKDLKVWGCAYYIDGKDVEEMKEYLDVREQDGYTTHMVPFRITEVPQDEKARAVLEKIPKDDNMYYIKSSVYIGTIDNESFIGPETIEDTGKVIKHSKGPSGENIEYLRNLCHSVRDLSAESVDLYLEDLLSLASK
ncbi:glutathione-specific gamma-glutamylcyclotransferase [[Candida] jaroonii]|uniref:Glutathione-specific gamma-glutamylcyclotransferase n=1 Tax=[Candida] jaroonii TaxID=467808 RepID=A0ACA9YA20_9ASCO|nr:glutathione-specific gamma-glutamylcyclotransferase [[Candida] jaroonii]